MNNNKFFLLLVLVIAFSISFVINSVIFTYFKARSADDWVKINSSSNQRICEQMGGNWIDDMGGSFCQKPSK